MAIEREWSRLAVVMVVAAATSCAGAPRGRPLPTEKVATGAGTLSEARKYLQGRWILESFEVRPPGKEPIALKGSGVLDYDDFGNLRMEIRADQASSDLLRAAGIDIRDGVIATEGRTVIDLQHRTLTYVLEGQPVSTGPLAASRPRHWEVTADTLTLTTRDEAGAPLSIGRWKRNR
jgi:hypothetical protein